MTDTTHADARSSFEVRMARQRKLAGAIFAVGSVLIVVLPVAAKLLGWL